MGNFEKHLLRDVADKLNVYDYFNRDRAWIFEQNSDMKEISVTFHEGDLTIDSMADLPENTEFLVVRGDLKVNERLMLVGYYTPPHTVGALIVTKNLYCKNMFLSWGDIVVMGDAHVEQYIYSDSPEFEQGSLDIRGEIKVPYLFYSDDNPSFYFAKNKAFFTDKDKAFFVNDRCDDDDKRCVQLKNGELYDFTSPKAFYEYLQTKKDL